MEEAKTDHSGIIGPFDLEITVEAQVKKSEAKEKVASAVSTLFKEAGELRVEENRVQFVSENVQSLQFIKDQFRDRRVRSAARRLLLSNQGSSNSNQTYLLLNKQAAIVGIAAICDDPRESPLGPLVLRIRSSNMPKVVDWLTAGYPVRLGAEPESTSKTRPS